MACGYHVGLQFQALAGFICCVLARYSHSASTHLVVGGCLLFGYLTKLLGVYKLGWTRIPSRGE